MPCCTTMPYRTDINIERLRTMLNYDAESGLFVWRKKHRGVSFGAVAGGAHRDGYVAIRFDGKRWQAHRLAWAYVYGGLPLSDVDHINRIRTDNRIANLRLVTPRENQSNGLRARGSGVGATKVGNRWKSYIHIDGKGRYLGSFPIREDAIAAYRAAAKANP